MFVAVGNWGEIVTSQDGVNWTRQTSGTSNHLLGVTANKNGQFAVVGSSGLILTSTCGVTWTLQSSGTAETQFGLTSFN